MRGMFTLVVLATALGMTAAAAEAGVVLKTLGAARLEPTASPAQTLVSACPEQRTSWPPYDSVRACQVPVDGSNGAECAVLSGEESTPQRSSSFTYCRVAAGSVSTQCAERESHTPDFGGRSVSHECSAAAGGAQVQVLCTWTHVEVPGKQQQFGCSTPPADYFEEDLTLGDGHTDATFVRAGPVVLRCEDLGEGRLACAPVR